ncbi:DUF1506 family protein (plasmid) [Borrelia nietonii YOR]|nr:DUF1506 family protein [Borrelia nietonii YOR]
MMIGLNLAITDNITRYSRPMFLFKKSLIRNKSNASYERKVDKETSIKFDGVFLFKGEDNIELFGSNIFTKEIYAKVYTLDKIDFDLGDQVQVDDDLMEIVSISKYCNVYLQERIIYTVLMLRKL